MNGNSVLLIKGIGLYLPQVKQMFMAKSKVVIIDDDMLSVESLQFELEKDNRFVVEGVARNGHQGRKLIEKIEQ